MMNKEILRTGPGFSRGRSPRFSWINFNKPFSSEIFPSSALFILAEGEMPDKVGWGGGIYLKYIDMMELLLPGIKH